jgi:hypothetical protein
MHWCSAPNANLGAPTRNSQNVKVRHADQPGNKRVTPCLINVLPLLNRRGWKKLIFKKCVSMQDVLCGVIIKRYVIGVMILWSEQGACCDCAYQNYINSTCITELYVHI